MCCIGIGDYAALRYILVAVSRVVYELDLISGTAY
jgi:hypothetical protein